MKNRFKLLLMFLFFVFIQKMGIAQSIDDQAKVLQKCIDLTELQQYFPKNADNSFKQLRILNFPVSFPVSVKAVKFDQPVLFQTREEVVSDNPDLLFTFSKFSVADNAASVVYNLNCNRNSATPSMVEVTVSLAKSADNWSITEFTLNTK